MIKNRDALVTVALVAVFSMACLMVAENAAGNDYKYVPGMMCVANNGEQEKYLRHWGTGLKNTHTGSVLVQCPIIRDNRLEDTMDTVVVRIIQNPTYITRCWLYDTTWDRTMSSVWGRTLTGSGPVFWYDPEIVHSSGFMSILCRLAPDALLYMYSYEEYDDTNAN